MSTIAILGAGRVGTALATGWAKAGHAVTLGARRTDAVRSAWQGPAVQVAAPRDAAHGAEIVVNALPGEESVAVLSALKAELAGKTLIDVANATRRDARGLPTGLLYADGSLGQRLQAALPDTRVVKTLNTVAFMAMANPGVLGDSCRVFVGGDDAGARAIAAGLLADLGWADEAIEDLGGIDSAAGTEALFLLVPYLVRARGFVPFALTVAR